MSVTARTKIAVAAGFLSLAGLVGGTAAVAAAAPGPQHDSPQAPMVGDAQPGTMPGDAQPGTMPGD